LEPLVNRTDKLMIDIDYPKGSEWRKWDLHVHIVDILEGTRPAFLNREQKYKNSLQDS